MKKTCYKFIKKIDKTIKIKVYKERKNICENCKLNMTKTQTIMVTGNIAKADCCCKILEE